MAQGPKHINSFRKGMVVDIDRHFQPADSYRYSRNGLLAGTSEAEGTAYAWQPAKGTQKAIEFPQGYRPVGLCEIDGAVFCFLYNDSTGNSELGIAFLTGSTQDTLSFSYQTLFNDRLDANGDKLNLNDAIQSQFVKDSEDRRLVYFGKSESRVWVVNISGLYNPEGKSYHSLYPTTYPAWLSVHSMQIQMDLTFPDISFYRRLDNATSASDPTYYNIAGSLKTGIYRYAMRYVSKNGYKSPWSHLSQPFFVTDRRYDSWAASNHHRIVMGASGKASRLGNEIRLDGLDTRWYRVEVAYIYQETNTSVAESKIFARRNLVANGNILYIPHLSNSGDIVNTAEFQQILQTLDTVTAFAEHKSKMFYAGVGLIADVTMKTENVKFEPVIKTYQPDITTLPTFKPTERPGQPNARKDNDPLTNNVQTNGNIEINTYLEKDGTPAYKTRRIVQDYASYKGVQFHAELSGYRRGEVYPFFLTPIDRKGNPLPSILLGYYNIPELYDGNGSQYNLTRLNQNTNLYEIQIMGVKLSNISFKRSDLYDDAGELKLSAFMITRGEASGRIVNQGVLVPTTIITNGEEEKVIRPLPSWMNDFENAYAGGSALPGSHKVTPNARNATLDSDGGGDTTTNPNYFHYHSPDILIKPEDMVSRTRQNSDEIKIVASVHHHPYNTSQVAVLDQSPYSFYNKLYRADNVTGNQAFGRPEMGARSRIDIAKVITDTTTAIEAFDQDHPKWRAHPDVQAQIGSNGGTSKSKHNGRIEPNAMLLKLPDFESADMAANSNNIAASFHIVNYIQSVASTQDASVPVPHFSTGHYQPINEQVLNSLPTHVELTGADETSELYYDFNGIEVFGGDTYLTLADMLRIYPDFSTSCSKLDYASGIIVPIESKWNLSLRLGRSLAANGIATEGTICAGLNPQLQGGVFPMGKEEWNMNTVLLRNELSRFYFARNQEVQSQEKREATIYYSKQRIDGELVDSYRQILPLNYRTLEGSLGKITALVPLFDNLYCFREKAFGRLRINDRAAMASDIGTVYTGSGQDLEGIDYISKHRGLQQRSAIVTMGNAIYWIDSSKGIFTRFSQAGVDELSYRGEDEKLLQSLTDSDMVPDSNQKIYVGADPENRSIWMTFIGDQRTLCLGYYEKADAFHGFMDFAPTLWATYSRFALAFDPLTRETHFLFKGRRGEFFNRFYDAQLEWVVNPTPNAEAKFDNCSINVPISDAKRLGSIECSSENLGFILDLHSMQGSQVVKVLKEARWQSGIFSFPLLSKVEKGRLRGNYLSLKLTIRMQDQAVDNENLAVIIPTIEVNFRPTAPR